MDVRSPSEVVLPPLMRSGGELGPETLSALCRHPQFPRAMRAVLAGHVDLYRGNRILNYVGYDRGRLVVGVLAIYLHVSRRADDPTSGLTVHALQSLCVEQDLCSPGRARAMLSVLRLFGYVAPAPGSDRRYKLLAPTDLLTDSLRQRWSMMFGAMALVLPEGVDALARLARDEFVAVLVRHVIDRFRSGLRALLVAPELRLFAERNAGLNILFSLVVAGDVDDTVPPTRPIRISISELARRFSVSRAHVLRLLRDATAEGLVARSGAAQDAITILPPLARALREGVAIFFLVFAQCARAAMADVGAGASEALPAS